MTSFPILKLPYLVFVQLLESMKFLELLDLSRISKRMRRLVKSKVNVRNHHINIFIEHYSVIIFESDNHNVKNFSGVSFNKMGDMLAHEVKIPRRFGKFDNVPSYYHELGGRGEMVETYWDDTFIAIQEVYSEVQELLEIPIKFVDVDLNSVEDNYKDVLGWINQLAPNIEWIRIMGDQCDSEAYIYAIENVESPQVEFLAKPENFMEKETLNLKNIREIYIKYGQWIKLDHLKSMTGSHIKIGQVSFTDEDFNKILVDLKNGTHFVNLERMCLQIERNEIEVDVLLNGLEVIEELEFLWFFKLDNGKQFYVEFTSSDSEEDPEMIDFVIEKLEWTERACKYCSWGIFDFLGGITGILFY